MKVCDLALHRYRYGLVRPLETAVRRITHRSGVVLELRDSEGRRGFGEAAPLPGFSEESLAQVMASLGTLRRGAFGGFTVPIHAVEHIDELVSELDWAPSARHAVEQALLDLLSQEQGIPVAGLLAPTWCATVPVHALVQDTDDALAAIAAGTGCLKMKVGGSSLASDVARVRRMRAAIGPEVQLRLDANGAWDAVTARAALKELSEFDIACLEQPVPAESLGLMAELSALELMPIAADESVRSAQDLTRVVDTGAASVVVVKPMLVGGLRPARALVQRCSSLGLGVYVTTTLEAYVGRLGALHLAAACGSELLPCGLVTGPLLLDEPERGPLPADGHVHLASGTGLGVTHWGAS